MTETEAPFSPLDIDVANATIERLKVRVVFVETQLAEAHGHMSEARAGWATAAKQRDATSAESDRLRARVAELEELLRRAMGLSVGVYPQLYADIDAALKGPPP